MWRKILRENFTRIEPLCTFLNLDETQQDQLLTSSDFPLNLPRRLAHKIEKGCLDDPILRQFVPLKEESESVEGFGHNPVGDEEARKGKRLLKKYKNRALLMPTSACAMHCRYCFRRHFDYAKSDFLPEIEEIKNDQSLNEVILSGGDPLSLGDEQLFSLIDRLDLPHIKRIRFHSRFPVGIPERIDDSFLAGLERAPMQIWFVLHINHPNELDPFLFERIREIQRLGIPVLNQAVLLRGINDNLFTLKRLFEELVDHGISPYYLHKLDQVAGAAHFEADGKALMASLAKELSGYALPRFVKEEAGMPHKTLIPL